MKKLLYLALLFMLFISCGSDKIYDKQVNNDEINIDWYHYSYISSGSPNYVVVRKKDKEEIIFEHGWGIQDVKINKDTITILHLKFQTKPEIKKDNVFDYVIQYKEVSSHEMYIKFLEEQNKKESKKNHLTK